MAYRRSLSTRATLLAKRFNPTFSYIHHEDDRKRQSSSADFCQSGNNIYHGYCTSNINTKTTGLGALFRDRSLLTFSLPLGIGSTFRYYSSSIGEKGLDNVEYSTDVTEILADNVVELASSQASTVSEVATAAADSFYPIAALQYLIDGVHSFTGLNWWASIVVTTIIIRGVTVPLLINQLKCTTKLTLMRPRLEEIKQEMQDRAMEPDAVSEGKRRMMELFREYGVTPLTPLKGIFIQGPIFISFYLAISNMVEKVPSFKEGGAFWFTDLTTPDNLYIFPVLTALTFLITVECNVQEGLEGNPVAGTIKKFSRVFAVLTVPITMVFPKGIFCYWVTSNLFSLAYGLVIKRPDVKKLLNIPIVPEAPAQPASLSFMTPTPYKPTSQEPSTPSTKDGSISSSSVISERLQALEKQVQGRQKSKK